MKTWDDRTYSTFYQVAYVNWRGQWTMDGETFETQKQAQKREKWVAQHKAENGRTSVRTMTK
jgi:hypothetical protein